MITAERLAFLSTMSTSELTDGVRRAGHKKDNFVSSKFLGLSRGYEFCYCGTYLEENKELSRKVFVRFDHVKQTITVDYF